jgi:purine-nucleoside phosphorylase
MATLAEQSAAIIRSRCSVENFETAVLLDRVFYALADLGERLASIPYANLPGFPTGAGLEDAEAIVTLYEGAPTLLLKGKTSFHETGDPSLMGGAIATLATLGVRGALCTGLARSVQADLSPSSLVLITDHINFTGLNPLIAAVDGAASVNMNEAYDKRLLRRLKGAASNAGVTANEGVLMWFSGPSDETPAEARVARQLGADLLGWTIAPEAILARRYGVPFAGLAIITDFSAGVVSGNTLAERARDPSIAGVIATKRLLRAMMKGR